MASRDILSLETEALELAQRFISLCQENEFDVLIYCTHRHVREQAVLYRQGRALSTIKKKAAELRNTYGRPDLADVLMDVGPQYGKRILTYAGPGQSMHNYGLALDGVPMDNGKAIWSASDPAWETYGRLGVEAGFEWAGNWRRFKEFPHLQVPGSKWRELIRR